MFRLRDLTLVTATAVLTSSIVCAADGTGGITTTGTATIKSWPEAIRVTVTLRYEGEDAAAALALLAASHERALGELAEVGLRAEDVTLANLTLGEPMDGLTGMHPYMVAQMGRAAAAVESEGAVVSAMLSFDVPIDASTPEDGIVRADALQKQLRTALADLEPELTPAQQEAREEMQLYYEQYGQAMAPGAPRFAFVASVTEDRRRQATAEAFADAKSSAQALASAMGTSLGPVRALSYGAGTNAWELQAYAYMGAMAAAAPSLGSEVLVDRFMEAAYTVSVTAGFAIE